jgi:hypothetical protein
VTPPRATASLRGCTGQAPLAARAFAASCGGEGLAILGGEITTDDCLASAPTPSGVAAQALPCGGFSALPSPPPLPDGGRNRVGALATRHPVDGSLWLIGGRAGVADDAPAGDVWRLPVGSDTWLKGTSAVSGRSHGTLLASSSPKALWLYGGDIGPGGSPIATAELRKLLANQTTWQLVAAGGALPGPRRGAAGASLGDRLALFGGADATDSLRQDVHVLHAATDTWTRVQTIGDAPTARSDAAMVARDSEHLLVFGGFDATWGQRNDLYRLDLTVGAWTKLRQGDLASDGSIDGPLAVVIDACALPAALLTPALADPEARAGAALHRVDSGDLLLFGGHGRCGALDDLWRLDAAAASWARLRAPGGGICAQRSQTCATFCAMSAL